MRLLTTGEREKLGVRDKGLQRQYRAKGPHGEGILH